MRKFLVWFRGHLTNRREAKSRKRAERHQRRAEQQRLKEATQRRKAEAKAEVIRAKAAAFALNREAKAKAKAIKIAASAQAKIFKQQAARINDERKRVRKRFRAEVWARRRRIFFDWLRGHPFLAIFLIAIVVALAGFTFSWRVPRENGYVVWKMALAVAALDALAGGITLTVKYGVNVFLALTAVFSLAMLAAMTFNQTALWTLCAILAATSLWFFRFRRKQTRLQAQGAQATAAGQTPRPLPRFHQKFGFRLCAFAFAWWVVYITAAYIR